MFAACFESKLLQMLFSLQRKALPQLEPGSFGEARFSSSTGFWTFIDLKQ
jgi:hypothetical protein